MKVYEIDSDDRCEDVDTLKCGGCNEECSVFFGAADTKEEAINQFDEPEEGCGKGLCSFCMCQFLVNNAIDVEYKK